MITPKVGQLLYRGCSCDEFGRITRIGKCNEKDVMDIELVDGDINDLYTSYLEDDSNRCAGIKIPEGTKVELVNVEWKSIDAIGVDVFIVPDEYACSRCMRHFYPHDEGKEIDWDAK